MSRTLSFAGSCNSSHIAHTQVACLIHPIVELSDRDKRVRLSNGLALIEFRTIGRHARHRIPAVQKG